MTSASSAPAPAGGGLDGGPAPRAAPRGWLVLVMFACLYVLATSDRVADSAQIPPGHSLGLLPFLALGRLLEATLGWRLPTLVLLNGSSALFAALAVLFVWRTLADAFAVPPRRALVAAALYGLGTSLLPYSKLVSVEAQLSALVAALVYHTLAPPRASTLPALALIFGLLVLTKPLTVVLLPILLLGARAHGVLRVSTRASVARALARIGLCAAGLLAWSYHESGDALAVLMPWRDDPLSLSFLQQSLRVLFVSPEKNLFVFNPVLGLAAAGLSLPMESKRRWFLLGLFAAPLLACGVFESGTTQGAPGWGPRLALAWFPALVPFIALVLDWVRAQPLTARIALWPMVAAIGAASIYVQVLGASRDSADTRHVCEAYERLRVDRAWPACDADDISASALSVRHYLLWHLTRRDLERGTVPELPWVAGHFEPGIAQRIFTGDPRARAAALDDDWLFFGLPEKGAQELRLGRMLLGLLAGLCGVVMWRGARAA